MNIRLIFGILAVMVTLTGCGTVYPSQNVVSGAANGVKVRIAEMTAENVMLANRSSYTPRSLPAAFSQTAGLQGQMMGTGALPEPAYTAQTRPSQIETRLPPAATPEPYRIGTGDVVLLATPSGSSVDELAGLLAAQNNRQGYTVQDDGAIAIPNVGRISIAGLTIEEAESVLFQRLVEAQIEPTFSFEIAEFNSQKVSVGGAVSNPGNMPITLTPLYLDEVIANAGGVTAPSMEYVTVRLYRDGTLYQVLLTELYSSSGMRRILMKSGDIVFVDTAYELDQAAAYFQQQIQLASFRQTSRVAALNVLNTEVSLRRAQLNEARSNFTAANTLDAVDRDYVYLTGELVKPGRFTLPFNRTATLSDALFDGAGGLKVNTSDPREIYVLRGSSDPMEFDSVTAWHLNAKNVAHMVLATRFELRPNDVVFVSEKPVTRWNRTLSQITPQIINLSAAAVN
jgi:polysaccharide export outer membrane protein